VRVFRAMVSDRFQQRVIKHINCGLKSFLRLLIGLYNTDLYHSPKTGHVNIAICKRLWNSLITRHPATYTDRISRIRSLCGSA